MATVLAADLAAVGHLGFIAGAVWPGRPAGLGDDPPENVAIRSHGLQPYVPLHFRCAGVLGRLVRQPKEPRQSHRGRDAGEARLWPLVLPWAPGSWRQCWDWQA